MDVVYVFQDPYPWDIRVEKITHSLVEFGHRVHVVARNRRHEKVFERLDNNLDIYRLPEGFGKWGHYFANFPAFFSPFWVARLFRTVHQTRAGLIVVRDLPLAPTAVLVGRMTGTPVLMDMAEDYPAMIDSTWRFRGARLQDYLLRNPRLLAYLERLVVPLMNGILVVSEASRRRVRALNAVMPPIWVVGNTPRLGKSIIEKDYPLSHMMKAHSGLTLLYVGYLEHMRGLDVVVRALPALVAKGLNPLLVIVGEGDSRQNLAGIASSLGVDSHVHFAGWVDQRYLPTIVEAASICLVPHYVTAHTNTTLPNKIFDYMAQAKPVVVTDAEALRDIVETYRCGLTYTDTSSDELAQRLSSLEQLEVRERMGAAGLNAVRQTFNWGMDQTRLADAVQHVGRILLA